jgi:hypothetical protein
MHRWLGVWCAGLVVLAGGAAYRVTAAAVSAELAAKVTLDPPLSSLPLVIGLWQGADVPLSAGVQKIAMNDDYVNRQYRSAATSESVNLYIGYTARPRTMLRHRPTVCYPSAGWSHLGTRTVDLDISPAAAPSEPRDASPGPSAPSAPVPVLLHTFLKAGPTSEARVVVLNYYVLNGTWTVDENSFWGVRWRDVNSGHDVGRYVAQVQVTAGVSGSLEAAERLATEFARASAPGILELLPVGSGAAPPGSQ